MKKRLLYIGCDYYGECGLRAFLNSSLVDKFELVGVLTFTFHPGENKVVSLAKALPVPLYEGNGSSAEALQWLERLCPEVGIMMEYPKKLSLDFLHHFHWILNAHPSDLPDLRGGAPLEGLILQEKPLRITVHKVDAQFDNGLSIAKSSEIDIRGMHFYQVYELAAHLASKTMIEALEKVVEGFSGIPQDESKACYLWYKDVDSLLKINWAESDVFHMHRQILAGGPKRGASSIFEIDNTPYAVRILQGRAVAGYYVDPHGQAKVVENNILKVSAKGGSILIDKMVLEQDGKENVCLMKEGIFK